MPRRTRMCVRCFKDATRRVTWTTPRWGKPGQVWQGDLQGCAEHFPALLAFADDCVGFVRRPFGRNLPDWPAPVVSDIDLVATARDRAHGRRGTYVETEVLGGAVQHHLF